MTKVHKITLMVVDHDDLGADEVMTVIEHGRFPNDCISPLVIEVDSESVAWSDAHPLNSGDEYIRVSAFNILFSKERT